jgi:hypothetical protein
MPRATALYRAALVDLQSIGDRRCEASTCKNLADILTLQERHEQSAHLFREGIALRHELGDQAGLAECFEGLAATLCSLAKPEECATLLGAADELRDLHQVVPTATEHEALARLREAVRSALGPGEFERSWLRGRQMGVEDVVDLALARRR